MNPKNQTFEQSMAQLEQIVKTMERGEAPLEESLELFRKGCALVRTCQDILNTAELEVKKITADETSSAKEEPFQDGT